MVRLPIDSQRIARQVALTDAEHHYLTDVLRLRSDARLEVFDGLGGRYQARLIDPHTIELGNREEETINTRSILLAQGLAKADKMDLVIQKATELGVTSVVPFSSSRAVVRLEQKRAKDKVERWRRIAQSSARQCGRADVPRIHEIVSYIELLNFAQNENLLPLILYEGREEMRLSQAALASTKPLLLVVGPEGGFDDVEVSKARETGAVVVSLGRLILRTETAGIAALAVIQFLEGNLG